jgi:WD40 repeat protein
MDDTDIYIAGSTDSTIDLSDTNTTITIDMSDYYAAHPQSVYSISIADSISVDGSNWGGITDWLEEREIVDQHRADEKIRDSHPAVQHAWEQYQIMLNLAREELDDPNEDSQ